MARAALQRVGVAVTGRDALCVVCVGLALYCAQVWLQRPI